ncbi:MAG: hypothetical protein AB7P33_09505 [Dehalococcoidia bacterium]
MTSESESGSGQDKLAPTGTNDAESIAANALSSTMQDAASFVARFSEAAHAEACVGPVQTVGGHTVVPIASVSVQAGFGLGFGGGGDGSQGQGGGGGGGGGGRGAARVIAVVDITEDGANVRPVVDITALTLAGMALGGIALLNLRGRPAGGLLRMLRRQA